MTRPNRSTAGRSSISTPFGPFSRARACYRGRNPAATIAGEHATHPSAAGFFLRGANGRAGTHTGGGAERRITPADTLPRFRNG
jgi:hypothetical protein